MRGIVRRTAAGWVAVAALVMAAGSGCSAHTGDTARTPAGASHAPPSSSAAAEQPTATASGPRPVPVPTFSGQPVLSTAQLRRLVFEENATPGTRGMTVRDLEVGAAGRKDTLPPPTPAACGDLLAVFNGHAALSGVSQLINWTPDIYPGGTVLASYPRGGAARVFQVLKADLAQCHTMHGRNYVGTYTGTAVSEPAPALRYETLRFLITVPQPKSGKTHYDDYVFVRVGDATASLMMSDVDQLTPFPAALVAQQVQRLAHAQPGTPR